MTNEEAIKYLRQLYPYGGHCWLDEQRMGAIGMAIEALAEKSKGEPTHRTQADIKAAMQEVDEKSKAFTAAHQGETAEGILAQMRGEEPASADFKEFEQQYMKDNEGEIVSVYDRHAGLVDGAEWQRERIVKALLSEVLPCFMHGGEADEVVAKLEEVLDNH